MAKQQEQELKRLQTYAQDPALAGLDEQAETNQLLGPISKVFELFLGDKEGRFMEQLNENLSQEMEVTHTELVTAFDKLQTSLQTALKSDLSDAQRKYIQQLRSAITDVERRFSSLKLSVTPKAGTDFPTYQELFEYIEESVPKLHSVAVSAINILEEFEGDARLDAKALRNIEENIDVTKLNIEKYDDTDIRTQLETIALGLRELATSPPRVIERTSSGSLQIVSDASGNSFQGVTKITFSGATVSKDGDTVTVSISGGGGGALAVETPSGTVNGSNVTFSVTTAPAYIVSDGITYFQNAGYSLSGTTVTMDLAPSQFIRAIS